LATLATPIATCRGTIHTAFAEMMEEWVKKRNDFQFVLCLDVSRWGRFQDIDLSAQYSAECKRAGKQVIYTTIGKPREDDPLYPVYVQFERFRAAQFSRELSTKVWNGMMVIAGQGYWPGGPPPYGTRRLLLDEKREPVQRLEAGQRKSIQNQRVTLVLGDSVEVAIVQRIFHEFVVLGYSEYRIAEGLNRDRIPAPGGLRWGPQTVIDRLRRETYVGTLLYNRTWQRLKSPRRQNPEKDWVRMPEAFEGVITLDQFVRAQEILAERRQKYDPERMLAELDALHQQYGMLRSSLLGTREGAPGVGAYSHRFGSLDFAFQRLFQEQHERARELVQQQICQHVPEVLSYADFLVLDQKLALTIQPAVPVPNGYAAYWPFRPDKRHVIDITLGVILANSTETEILGYLAMPRSLAGEKAFRLSSSSARVDMFGRTDLAFLQQLL
jgi:DNA invertase Pin-like site-specific DNA recombinase